MKNILVKRTVKFIVSLALLVSIFSASACGDSKNVSTKAPEPTPTGTPEVTMQDILNSLGNRKVLSGKDFGDVKNKN